MTQIVEDNNNNIVGNTLMNLNLKSLVNKNNAGRPNGVKSPKKRQQKLCAVCSIRECPRFNNPKYCANVDEVLAPKVLLQLGNI